VVITGSPAGSVSSVMGSGWFPPAEPKPNAAAATAAAVVEAMASFDQRPTSRCFTGVSSRRGPSIGV
jgi:hypothetical protein